MSAENKTTSKSFRCIKKTVGVGRKVARNGRAAGDSPRGQGPLRTEGGESVRWKGTERAQCEGGGGAPRGGRYP